MSVYLIRWAVGLIWSNNQMSSGYDADLNSRVPLNWIAKGRELLASDHCSPTDILDFLSHHPFLSECYTKFAQKDGPNSYTVLQHTERVLAIAEKYRSCCQKDVMDLVTWNEFLLFLALHDIGKGIAWEKKVPPSDFKKTELETTQQILTPAMKMLEISAGKIRLFNEMLRYDTLGLYLQSDITLEIAKNHILEMAENCQQSPRDFYRIFSTYHTFDAASYDSLQLFFARTDSVINYCEVYSEMEELLCKDLDSSLV